ncbi:MAG: bifunctional RNase H/acid phosphatase [Nonomuraea muscovyensis]|uniref:Putative phosphoglycerate mutase n=1 Tax=Nonomuraea muscovyensis TaxID=1124761 RepID=A0A7X0F198_9ACTN|nr:bifunctional RNase H/acid phosphatase [Nonomuraea muscovyensis]MBB6349354.1 putative phosphoglycerate mutase [Nonomuraea muscovyensis]MDF2705910.1 bifunctional RNase H/acid phosphatase [Nonomuraea muscovyensis]
MTSYVIEADGGSRGNPGPAGYGAVVRDAADGQVLAETAEAIGVATNNVAEYRGLIAGLRAVLDLAGEGASVAVRMDSKLVIEQMAGRWKIKNEGLRPLALEAGELARRLRVTEWTWIPRHRNGHADRLANEAMDAAAKGLAWKAGGTTASGTGTPGASGVPGGGAAGAPTPGTTLSAAGAPGLAEQTDLLDVAEAAPPGTLAADLSGPAASVAAAQQRATGQAKGTGWAPPTRVATSLLLLRHGETPLSVERRFSGLGDAELTANGLAQAAAAARRLSREPYHLDAVVSSPLKRARQTAEAVARSAGLDIDVDEDLRETDFGAWEGHTFTEIQRRWPAELDAWLADPDVPPPGGESFAEVAARVRRAEERLVERYEGRTVLVVSHVTPIKTLLRLALMAPPEALYRMHLDLACLSLIEHYADGRSVVKSFNDTSHLR